MDGTIPSATTALMPSRAIRTESRSRLIPSAPAKNAFAQIAHTYSQRRAKRDERARERKWEGRRGMRERKREGIGGWVGGWVGGRGGREKRDIGSGKNPS